MNDELQVRIQDIEPESFKIYVFEAGRSYDRLDPFSLMLIGTPRSETEIEIHGTIGRMTADINVTVGLALLERGFEVIHFEANKNIKVTRFAEKISERGDKATYRVDLLEAAKHVHE